MAAGVALLLAAAGGAFSAAGEAPPAGVRVDIVEGIPAKASWDFDADKAAVESFAAPAFGLVAAPRRYSERGIVVDRSNPWLLRASCEAALPAGRWRILLRAFNAARLSIDGDVVVATPFKTGNADGHEAVPDSPPPAQPGMAPAPAGHFEAIVEVAFDGAARRFRLEAFVGGKGLRREIGELLVAVAPAEGAAAPFRLLSPEGPGAPLDESSCIAFAAAERARVARIDDERRRAAGAGERAYWSMRHDLARRALSRRPPIDLPAPRSTQAAARHPIDRFIDARLEAAGAAPEPLVDDHAFLRRVSLDTRGVPPAPEEIAAFFAADPADRRARFIDRCLASESWADHQVPYWQDVLAENPGILKPELNNTGPFRWWIRDAFADNLPMDRFATELIRMEGSRYGGAPAGFAVATQNDAPLAAKAHIIGTAFLGVEMRCSRCHDAPEHSFTQEDLFRVAAMLARKPIELPATSSVPRPPEEIARMIITVSLEPGARIEPSWPFESIAPSALPDGVLRDPADPRERLAAIVTSPESDRFARVIANRLWKRLLGHGLVEPVDDWEGREASHPELLDWLGRELIASGYDIKHLARQILGSHAYQRRARGDAAVAPPPAERLFAGPARRRLGAEQVVDSLFAIAGKRFDCEELNLDVDGRRPVESFLNLGAPRRAWEMTSLSNERDRPALSMPAAQSVVDVLKTFGWRESRQDPVTTRPDTVTVLQPLILANGVAAQRIATLSDDSALTRLCLEDRELDDLIDAVVLRVLSRPAAAGEMEIFRELLAPGFAERRDVEAPTGAGARAPRRNAVSWSNHLSAEATRIKLELERIARAGDPPTQRLRAEWRERMEDVVWALINSAELLFVP